MPGGLSRQARLITFVLVAAGMLHGCNTPDENNVEMIFAELDHCPSLTMSRNPAVEEQVLARMEAIRQYPLRDIREAIARANGVHLPREGPLFGHKIHILNAYIFNVPERYPRAKARLFYTGIPLPMDLFNKDRDCVNLMYPLGYTREGRITIVGTYACFVGPPYDALGEFDYFNCTFGLRKFDPERPVGGLASPRDDHASTRISPRENARPER